MNMMNQIIQKIKKYFEEINNKKFINNLFIILLVSIILLIVANIFLDTKKEDTPYTETEKSINHVSGTESDYSNILEKKLINILSQLKGVGKVNVMITLEDSTEKIAATNTTKTSENTNEVDSQGGTREVVREDMTVQIVTKGSDGSLLVVKEIKPTVKGVIVVAEGADDAEVKEKLYEAVKTVLGISGSKVEIYSSK